MVAVVGDRTGVKFAAHQNHTHPLVTMSLSTEALFTAALGLQSPWQVKHVELSTAKRRIDFEVECKSRLLSCPHCGHADQGIHDRVDKSWRHLDFFQYEAWLHAPVPRVACTACGKTTQVSSSVGPGGQRLYPAVRGTGPVAVQRVARGTGGPSN
jgi:Zn ribbon nucleic-acid-binding protein